MYPTFQIHDTQDTFTIHVGYIWYTSGYTAQDTYLDLSTALIAAALGCALGQLFGRLLSCLSCLSRCLRGLSSSLPPFFFLGGSSGSCSCSSSSPSSSPRPSVEDCSSSSSTYLQLGLAARPSRGAGSPPDRSTQYLLVEPRASKRAAHDDGIDYVSRMHSAYVSHMYLACTHGMYLDYL